MQKKHIIPLILFVPFILLWFFVFLMLRVAYNEGVLSVLNDAFGKWSVYALAVFAVIAFFSVFYLRFFTKKELIIQVVSYILLILFSVSVLALVKTGEAKFEKFTTQNWIDYPNRRFNMYLDLNKRHVIKGCSAEEVEILLGKPDDVSDGTYVYGDEYGNAVYVYFDDGAATAFGYVE